MAEAQPPKDDQASDADLRSVLESFRRSDPNAGPLARGLRDSDRILIASFANPRICWRFRRDLATAGVASTISCVGTRSHVEVRFVDREKAFSLLARQQLDYPDIVPPGSRRDFDFTLLSTVVGAFLGCFLLFIPRNRGVGLVGCVGLTATGAVIGFAADRVLRNLRFAGRFQFRVLDCFMLILVIALVITFWTTFSRYL